MVKQQDHNLTISLYNSSDLFKITSGVNLILYFNDSSTLEKEMNHNDDSFIYNVELNCDTRRICKIVIKLIDFNKNCFEFSSDIHPTEIFKTIRNYNNISCLILKDKLIANLFCDNDIKYTENIEIDANQTFDKLFVTIDDSINILSKFKGYTLKSNDLYETKDSENFQTNYDMGFCKTGNLI